MDILVELRQLSVELLNLKISRLKLFILKYKEKDGGGGVRGSRKNKILNSLGE